MSKRKLEDLFCQSDLKYLQVIPPTKRRKIISCQPETASASPLTKRILASLSPQSKIHMKKLIYTDNEQIEQTEQTEDNDDPYESNQSQEWGRYIESVISVYGTCPVCNQQTLRPYANPNMPVVDLICLNKHDCFLFQVKLSFNDSYFNLKEKFITVGSKSVGEQAHQDKKLCPGYICVRADRLSETEIKIIKSKSFVLIPISNSFTYVNKKSIYNKPMITWSDQTNKLNLKSVLDRSRINFESFETQIIINPMINLNKLKQFTK